MLFLLNYCWRSRTNEQKQHREQASLAGVVVFGTNYILTLTTLGHRPDQALPVRCTGRACDEAQLCPSITRTLSWPLKSAWKWPPPTGTCSKPQDPCRPGILQAGTMLLCLGPTVDPELFIISCITAPGQAIGSEVRNAQHIKHSQGPTKPTSPFVGVKPQWNERPAWSLHLSAWKSRNWSQPQADNLEHWSRYTSPSVYPSNRKTVTFQEMKWHHSF